ncbi:50S ribosomal protein L4 [Patescibacteria group bacterium]|nr:50S ribosomal protein L4 [Patescibacteria group bacterium]MBU0776792.1 50S ribosomal protein L4 [Patescibacteria group bacterium]MBU0845633.1 50S ribosomal protein L4 [Patescibacteria group bacterium]MBU0922675.1 50S ribosomal protein L4 [Patescibacteria group bacterium]MBU1066726.1 50S ribosomal protein L4 [Patescibacteria group bacterium]
MTKLDVFSAKGVKKQAVNLPKDFIEKENPALLAQAIRVYEGRLHSGLSKVKTRGEVVASKRKIYRQKGTGRARHGALSAPIFVGGGKAHGPKGVKRQLELPKKMRRKALGVALGAKVKNGDLLVVDGLSSLKKTKEAQKLVDKILKSKKKGGRVSFVLSEKSFSAVRAIRNIPNAEAISFHNLNIHQVYYGGVLILDKEILTPETKAKTKKEETSSTKTRKVKK